MKATATQISEQTKQAITTYLSLNDKFRNSYFWSSPSNAASRRSYENRNHFEYEGDGISLSFIVRCSCKNIYVSKSVAINRESKTAAALKKYVK